MHGSSHPHCVTFAKLEERGNVADVHKAGDVFVYRDSSTAALLDLRRRIKAVMDVLDSSVRNGVSLARSPELTIQWECILRKGLVSPLAGEDLQLAWGGGVGEFRRVVGEHHCRLSDFVHRAVVHGTDEAIRGWRHRLREDPQIHPYKWLRPDLVPPSPFLQCKLHLTPEGSGSWLTLLRSMRNSERLGFSTLVVLGKGKPALRNLLWKQRTGHSP